ncbi:bifunctional nicotinamidase/pyrazinamidase [Myroides indicus]|nr:bifunctional nicotinamidase/pyrazinamidase [Myroides indicus]
MKALLVVDLQYDFLPGGKLAVPNGNEIIEVINRIQEKFELIIATQDWHPQNHKSFASQYPAKKVFDVVDLNGLNQVLWPDHCISGTKGAEFTKEWNSNCISAIFRKGLDREIDSYSGFFDNGKRRNTGLAGYLRDKNVSELYICGLAADFCVFYSAVDAVELDFRTYFLDFATKPITDTGLIEAKKIMKLKGIEIVENENQLIL